MARVSSLQDWRCCVLPALELGNQTVDVVGTVCCCGIAHAMEGAIVVFRMVVLRSVILLLSGLGKVCHSLLL